MNKFIKSLTKASLISSFVVGLSFSVNANDVMTVDLSQSLERNIAAQMREVKQVVLQEIRLSVQAQLSESLFEMQDSVAIAKSKATKKEPVITSASVK